MKQITQKQLEQVVNRINEVTNSPMESYSKTAEKFKANIGNYHLSYAYGGVCLHRIVSDCGGVEDVFYSGHTTKRDLYNRMQSYLLGLEK